MSTTHLPLQPEMSQQARTLRSIANVMAVIMVIVTAVFSYLAIQDGAWQLFGAAGAAATYLAIAVASIWLIRRQRHILAAWLLLLGCALCALAVSALVANLGLWLGLIAFLPASQIASLALPSQQTRRAFFAGALIGVAAFLVDVLALPGRIASPTLQSVLPVAGSILVLTNVVPFLRQVRDFSLQSKLAIAFVALTTLAVAGVAFVVTQQVEDALTERVGEGLQAEAVGQAQAINLFFHEKVSQMQVLALIDVIKEGAEAQNKSYSGSEEEILAEIQRLNDYWVNAPDDDPFIEKIITPFAFINKVAIHLLDARENLPDHIEIFVTDRYGATVAATNRLSDYYQADEAWWQAAWNEGQGAVYISDPEFDESANANALLLAVPIYGEGNEVIGILRSTLVVDSLFELIGDFKIGETGHAELFTDQGEVLYDPVVGGANDSAQLPAEVVQGFLTGAHGHFDVAPDEHGDLSVFGHQPLHAPDEIDPNDHSLQGQIGQAVLDLNWIVVARQEAEEALAPVEAITRTIQLIGLAIVTLATVSAVFLARIIVRPILALNQATEAVAGGNMNVQLPASGGDEIGQLTYNFQRMMGQLKQTLGNLQARSRDLSLAVDVGREMTQVQELETMLQNAVNIIRKRFNLYYAQIYLTDPAGNSLILRAGTGEAGQKLVRRGHRLPIGLGSINGTAATNRQAVIVSNTTTSKGHRANPLLPETRSEMAVPLIVDEKLVGVLDLQSAQIDGLTDENVPGFTALAAQLAVAIQNATLFSETQQARAEVEAYTQRLAQQGWQGFLNGIDRSQHLAAAYDLAQEAALSDIPEPEADEHEVAVPITIAGASVGAIRLVDGEERGWTDEETDLLTAVAEKVARHIENLRLLTEAEKYRMEAETVVRRLTREGWQSYRDTAKLPASGFIYDQADVLPLRDALEETAVKHKQPLLVRGEAIGELTIAGIDADAETQSLLKAVTEKVSERLEAIRLTTQTEDQAGRLAELAEQEQLINQITQKIQQTRTMKSALQIAIQELGQAFQAQRTAIQLTPAEHVNGQ